MKAKHSRFPANRPFLSPLEAALWVYLVLGQQFALPQRVGDVVDGNSQVVGAVFKVEGLWFIQQFPAHLLLHLQDLLSAQTHACSVRNRDPCRPGIIFFSQFASQMNLLPYHIILFPLDLMKLPLNLTLVSLQQDRYRFSIHS